MRNFKVKCNSCNVVSINGMPCHESGCHDSLIYTYRGKEYKKFRVFSLDVWGNKKQGFEVNDRSECNKGIMVSADLTDKHIIQALKKASLLNSKCHIKSFRIDGDSSMLMVDAARTSEPIYQLEAI